VIKLQPRRLLIGGLLAIVSATTAMSPRTAQQPPLVRGRLQRTYQNGQWFPAPGLGVTLRSPTGVRSSLTYSGSDGMFYLSNVRAGDYVLEIWLPRSTQPFRQVNVSVQYHSTAANPLCDLAPVNLPP
jgi:hypothetical protein